MVLLRPDATDLAVFRGLPTVDDPMITLEAGGRELLPTRAAIPRPPRASHTASATSSVLAKVRISVTAKIVCDSTRYMLYCRTCTLTNVFGRYYSSVTHCFSFFPEGGHKEPMDR